MTFRPPDAPVVYIESVAGGDLLEDATNATEYAGVYDTLATLTMDNDESRTLIAEFAGRSRKR